MSHKTSRAALASRLGYSEERLLEIAGRIHEYYAPFHLTVTKPNGKVKVRHIDNPHKKFPLRALQKAICRELLLPEVKLLPAPMIGGVKGRKLIEHLTPHSSQPTVVCMDLQDCFPNISWQRIFNVWRDILGYEDELAKLLACITTFRGYLPQGPPTSPILCNFALSGMAKQIEALCTINNLAYTQFIDDVCISGDDHVARAVIGEVHKIVNSHGQMINSGKTEIMDAKHRQASVRITLNGSPKVQQKYIFELLNELKMEAATGAISSGEKVRLWGKILYLGTYSPTQANRLKRIFETTLQGVSVYTDDLPKRGKASPCWRYKRDLWGTQRCPKLHSNAH